MIDLVDPIGQFSVTSHVVAVLSKKPQSWSLDNIAFVSKGLGT